jgi:hypothetical protein
VTFRWCCVRVTAPEIAFVGFDHLPVAWSNSLPLRRWDVSQQYNHARRLGFCRKSRLPEKKKGGTSFPVRFRESQFSIANPQSRKLVVLAGLKLGEQEIDVLLDQK